MVSGRDPQLSDDCPSVLSRGARSMGASRGFGGASSVARGLHRLIRAPEGSGGAAAKSPARPPKVLVVEDEALIALEIVETLKELGAEVVGIAMTADDAVLLAAERRPDCATMDFSIRGNRDGVSAAVELYETLGIRSIFVTAYGSAEIKGRAEQAKPVGWLQKPIAPEDLSRLLAQVDLVS